MADANSFFDWIGSTLSGFRFIARDTARSDDVNDALDYVSAGFTAVEVKTDAAIKLPDGETAAAIGNAVARAGMVLSFDAVTGDPETTISGTDIADAAANASAAAASAAAAAASFDSFDDRYLGPKAVEPAVDNDGNALVEGALYFNTVAGAMKVWTGAAWDVPAAFTNSLGADMECNNYNLKEIKTATFNSQVVLSTTTGNVAIDWSAAQNYKQNEPTGNIDYSAGGFTDPPGPCHLQLLIDSDGTSSAFAFTWPASVIWIGTTWGASANKKAIINFWFDGTNYFAMGANEA